MLKDSHAFSGFSVDNLGAAKKFYGEVLGLDVAEDPMGLHITFAGGKDVYVYAKDDHTPATYTILNFPVDDIDSQVDELKSKGIVFEEYDFGNGAKTDEKGIMRGLAVNMGPDIAWFKDPAGNLLSVLNTG